MIHQTARRAGSRLFTIALIALSTLFLSSTLFVSQAALAAESSDSRLQVSPTNQPFGTLEPGKTYESTFEVQNTGSAPYSYEVSVEPYSISDGTYTVTVGEGGEHYAEIVDWVEIDEPTGTVESKSQNVVAYSIHVPEDAPAGLQRAALVIALKPEGESEGNTNIQMRPRVAIQIYGNIAGETRKTADVIKNQVPGFLFTPPITVTSVVKNTGNIYTEATYQLDVYDFFGGHLAYTNEVYQDGEPTVESHVIFPETERYNEVSWEGAPQLGIFKVKQTITIFDKVSTVEKVVFLCPMWFLVIVLIFVFVAIFWIVSRLTGRKK